MNTLLNLMKSRRGIRSFSIEPVPRDLLTKILEAAISAPSGPGMMGTHIIVVDDPEDKRRLREICENGERHWFESQPKSLQERLKELPEFSIGLEYLEKAPHLLVVTTRPRDPEIPYAVEAAFLAVGFMLVMVEGQGLGTVTYTPSLVRELDVLELNQALALPEGETVQVILPIGYPEIKPDPKPGKGFFNVYHGRYGNRFL